MKFLKSHKIIHSDKLFRGKYKYKIVFSSSLSGWFRNGNLAKIKLLLVTGDYYSRNVSVSEKLFAGKLVDLLQTCEEWHIRVETPNISLYMNSINNLESITKLVNSRIKYISFPDPKTESKLEAGTVLVKKIDYDFKVTLGATNQNYLSFIAWCKDNVKIRLPKRTVKDLSKSFSAGGGYLYVKDDKNLTMVKMFLGRTITKVENVVRA